MKEFTQWFTFNVPTKCSYIQAFPVSCLLVITFINLELTLMLDWWTRQVSISCVIILNQDVKGEGLLLPCICHWFDYFLQVPSIYEIFLYPAFLVVSNTTMTSLKWPIACSFCTGCWDNCGWLIMQLIYKDKEISFVNLLVLEFSVKCTLQKTGI